MTRVSEAFPSKYISAPDLNGQSCVLTIDAVKSEGVGTPPEMLPVAYFQGTQKGLVLNVTNANTIALHHGDEMDNWGGKQIEIYPTTTPFAGKIVDCIRVRAPGQVPIPAYTAQEKTNQTLVRPPAAALPVGAVRPDLSSEPALPDDAIPF